MGFGASDMVPVWIRVYLVVFLTGVMGAKRYGLIENDGSMNCAP